MTARIIVGDCLDVLPTLALSSVDAIVTDPPYHLTTGKKGGTGTASLNPDSPAGRSRVGTGFMGKAWDGGDVAFRRETWEAALRVAKPGAHLVAFGGTRTFHRLTCAIEDAGWEIRDVLSYLYGSGFPKSHNGAWGGTALKPAWEPIILARKPLVRTVAANYERFGTGALNIDGCRISTSDSLGGGAESPENHQSDKRHDGYARPYRDDAEHRDMLASRDKSGNDRGYSRANSHPTVKPLDLMQWLCRLVTPKCGLILDPFCGSGSTGRAAVAEGCSFIGIELSEEYAEIARARIAEYAPLFAQVDDETASESPEFPAQTPAILGVGLGASEAES